MMVITANIISAGIASAPVILSILHLYLEQFQVPQGIQPGQVISVTQPDGQV
jgi:hypothetical protein